MVIIFIIKEKYLIMKIKNRIFKKKINMFLNYIRKPKNEFGFFVCSIFWKHHSLILPANIFIDDGNNWIKIINRKIILFQSNKSYERNWKYVLAMTIENEPKIFGKIKKMDLNKEEIDKLKIFVKTNQEELINLANNSIGHIEFFKNTGLFNE